MATTIAAATAATTAATTTATTASKAATSATKLNADFDTFLTLLTTQLKNQDPTKAMDTNELTAQLVSFAQVEQQISMNDNFETLIALQQTGQLTAAAPMLGQMVEVEADRLALQDGRATLRLPAAGVAQTATVQILDERGVPVRSAQVKLGAAAQEWQWDGRDRDGRQLADGVYRFAVTGTDADGQAQPVTPTVIGRATAVERKDGVLTLLLGKLGVSFEQVRGLRPG